MAKTDQVIEEAVSSLSRELAKMVEKFTQQEDQLFLK